MAERKIIWTATADKQLQLILDYWLDRNRSAEYPNKILRLVDEYVEQIANRPDSYRLTEHRNNRVCVMGTFSIYFKRINNTVYITSFWDNRQNPKRLKRILKRKDGT
jgi:plasmid stabilization system protein ParE